MDPTTQILAGIVLLFIGGFITRLFFPGVSRTQCALNHVGFEKYFNAKFKSIEDRLHRIEGKLDRKNGAI